MNEINDLRQEISSLQLKLQQVKLNQSGNNKVCRKDKKIIIEDLRSKLDFYQRVNELLKDETMAKQRTIEAILCQNNELLKSDQYYNKNIEQETIVSKVEEKVNKLRKNMSRVKETNYWSSRVTAKGTKRKTAEQIIQYNPRNNHEINLQKVENTKNVFIVDDSMMKNITGTATSRANAVKMRPHPGATTVDIWDYIKPELHHKPDVIIIHCGTNGIENEINTVKKIKKLIKKIDEYDKQNPPKVVTSSLIKRYDQNFNDDIADINQKLQRFCNSKGLYFIDNNNIDRSCLNKVKLHRNRPGLSYFANNFKKIVGSLWKSAPLAKVYQNTHNHPKVSLDELKSLRIRNQDNVIVSYLKINSTRNKFNDLKLIIDENIDILCVVETKIDESFPTAQLILPGYHKPCWLDITDKSHLPSRLLSIHNTADDIQVILFEINLRNEKWMSMSIYRPPKQNNQYFLENLSSIVDHYWGIYDNYIFLGDFNMEIIVLHWHHCYNHSTCLT